MENNAFGWTQISSMSHLLIFFAEPSLCENQNHHDFHRKPTAKKYEKLLTCKRSSRFIDMLSFPKAFRRNFHRKWYESGDTFKFSWSDTYTWYHGCKIHRLIQGFHVSVELVELGEPKRARHRGTADKASQKKMKIFPEKLLGEEAK